jgi:hypothetical protein
MSLGSYEYHDNAREEIIRPYKDALRQAQSQLLERDKRIAELEAALAEARRDRDILMGLLAKEKYKAEAWDKVTIGSNHLASWLINELGDNFPSYETSTDDALNSLPYKAYDVWVCWAIIMQESAKVRAIAAKEASDAS